jgi:von Willebrand factor type A domain
MTHATNWVSVVFAVSLSACTCGGGPVGAPCQSAQDCMASLECLATQTCATKCSTDAQCAAAEKCSTSGGCVPKTGCGADPDCPTGQACTAAETCAQSCQGMGSCGSTAVCLSSGTCANTCTADSTCAANEKCSKAGGCIPSAGCGAREDCVAGQLCNQFGKCVADCHTTMCNPGASCASDGTCVPAAADGGAMACGGELFQAAKVNSNMLIALDKSGSMNEPLGNSTKWDVADSSLRQLTAQYQSQIQFGLMFFPVGPNRPDDCLPGPVAVPVANMSAAAVGSALGMNGPGGKTPIGAVLTAAGMVSSLADPMRANYVMLVTDGSETCQGNGVMAATTNLAQKGIKTFVIGFGSGVDAQNLSAIAVAGGTPRPGNPKYYQADDAVGLQTAFNQIAQGALGCEYRLATAPPDPAKVFVYVNGVLQAHDINHANGWDYTAATQRITFYGALCTLVATDATARVSIVYGCPDGTLVETDRPDGGAGLPNGSACTLGTDCASAVCSVGFCGLPIGAPCSTGNQCASTVCTNGVCAPGIN